MKVIQLSKYRNLTGESPNAVKQRSELGTSVVDLQVLNINLYLDRSFNNRNSHTEPFTPSEVVQLNWTHTNFELVALNVNSGADNFQPKGTKTITLSYTPSDDERCTVLKFNRNLCNKKQKEI